MHDICYLLLSCLCYCWLVINHAYLLLIVNESEGIGYHTAGSFFFRIYMFRSQLLLPTCCYTIFKVGLTLNGSLTPKDWFSLFSRMILSLNLQCFKCDTLLWTLCCQKFRLIMLIANVPTICFEAQFWLKHAYDLTNINLFFLGPIKPTHQVAEACKWGCDLSSERKKNRRTDRHRDILH